MQWSEWILLQVVRRGQSDLSLIVKESTFWNTTSSFVGRCISYINESLWAEEEKVYPCHARWMTAWVGMLWRCGVTLETPKCQSTRSLSSWEREWELFKISEDPEQWLVTPMCQRMTSQPLRHQGKSLIRFFSLKIRSRIGDSDVPEHEKSFRS